VAARQQPGPASSSTSDDYWAGQAAWHQSLFGAGFFGMSWPTDIGGREAERLRVIVDDSCRPPVPARPSLAIVQGILEPATPTSAPLPPRNRERSGAVVPRLQWTGAGSDLAALRTRRP
jgi:alkylation response protein AidB-like acyl-CoA dehydrogenase